MWADPVDNDEGFLPGKFTANSVRGCSIYFGYELVKEFLAENKLRAVIRAHEVQVEGFKLHKWGNLEFPVVITIFSAPNYCDSYKNQASILSFHVIPPHNPEQQNVDKTV